VIIFHVPFWVKIKITIDTRTVPRSVRLVRCDRGFIIIASKAWIIGKGGGTREGERREGYREGRALPSMFYFIAFQRSFCRSRWRWQLSNMFSQHCGERPHHRGTDFSRRGRQWHRPVGSIAIGCPAVIEDWMIPFAACTAAETLNAFQTTPQNCSFLLGSRPHLIYGFLGPTESVPQTASRSVHSFLQGISVWLTPRQTDHATCDICSSRPHLCNLCDV